MSASIGDPFVLASYGLPSRETKGKGKSAEYAVPNIFANWYDLPRGSDGQVTVAVQGDGIHVLDLTGLHTVSSQSLGPSSRFTCAPASMVLSEGEESYRYTFAVMSSSPEMEPSSSGRMVWRWRESIADNAGSSREKRTFLLSQPVSRIHVSKHSPNHVLLLSEDGETTCTNLDLEGTFSWKPSKTMKLLKAMILPRAECDFIEDSPSLPVNGVLLNLFLLEGERIFFQCIAFGHEGNPVTLDSTEIPLELHDVLDISFNESGFLSCIQKSGRWSSFRLSISKAKPVFTSLSTDLRLRGLAFNENTLQEGKTRRTVSTLSLSSSYVLLAGMTDVEDPQIAVLLWDVQYGVFLHSTFLPIPSTITSDPWVELISASPSQVLLCISPMEHIQQSQARSTLFVLPYNVASTSSIAKVLGRANQGARWLKAGDEKGGERGAEMVSSGLLALDAKQEALLQTIQDAIEEKRPLDAVSAFFGWLSEEKARISKSFAPGQNDSMDVDHDIAETTGQGEEDDEDEDEKGEETSEENEEEISEEKEEEKGKEKMKKEQPKYVDLRAHLGHTFVTRILRVVYMTDDSSSGPYSPQIVRYMMKRNAVRNGMLEGGLLSALLKRKDWGSIRVAFSTVPDISEDNMIKAVVAAVKANKANTPAGDKMAVDKPTYAVPVPANHLLATCLAYPSSAIPLRKAFRDNLNDIDDVMDVLNILSGWIAITFNRDIKFELSEVTKNRDGVPIVKATPAQKRKPDLLPEFENILYFIQAVLDSQFLKILQHPPSYEILQQIRSFLEVEIKFNVEVESLRGPLRPFVKAQARTLSEAKGGRRKGYEVDWRKRRKQIQEQNALSIGIYQIEELVF